MKKVMFIMLALLTVPVIHALAGPNSPGGGIDAGGAPIDGGISFLVAAAVGYGIKRAKDGRKKGELATEAEK